MPELPLSALIAVLRPFVARVFQHAPRLLAERQAGHAPVTRPASFMEEVLNETLDRIRGNNVESGWWRGLLDRFGQQYVAPDFLRKPALQEWLREDQVADDLKAIATWRIVGAAEDEAAVRDRLAQSYSDRTGETFYFAAGPIDTVVAILVAGYVGAIPNDQHALVGIVQSGISRIDERLGHFIQSNSTIVDPIARQLQTEHAEKELARICALRAFNPVSARSDIRKLLDRVDTGDLSIADEDIKHSVRYWTARLCATDPETLDAAKELRAQINDVRPRRDLSIVDALICVTDGDADAAIRLLRDRDDPDSRTVLFGVFADSRDASTALGEFSESIGSADAGFFTAVGWRNWALCMAEVGRWQDAAEHLAQIGDPWSEAPAMAAFEGIINSQLLLPVERRSTSSELQIFVGIRPIQGERARRAHSRATACFASAQAELKEIEGTGLEEIVNNWSWWLRLMDPNSENARGVHLEIRQDLESDDPNVRLMPFAWAFGVSFNPEPLGKYLSLRRVLGGLNEEELAAECLLLLTQLNANTITGRDFLEYFEKHHTRLAHRISDELLKTARITALIKDNQIERARALLEEFKEELNEPETMRLSAMINTHAGDDPRSELELAYRKTKDIIDLNNLIEYLKQADDREALLPLLQNMFERYRTAQNLFDLAVCLRDRPFFNRHQIIKVFDSNSDLVEQSPDLKAIKTLALFHSGRFSEAKELNDQLLKGPHSANALALDINIAVASGDWEHLLVIVEREWPNQDTHTAETLLSLAQIAGHQERSPERALQLARAAARKSPDDPRILAASYWLHFQLGGDEEADGDWLTRAVELSSDDDGPIWPVDFKTVVTEWMPERRDRLNEIEKNWLSGQIPTSIAATMFNLPLTRLLLQIPESNSEMSDRRKTASVPVVFGGRPYVELKESWSVGLDITSVFILYYLDLLELVIDSFHQIKLSPDIMQCLFREQDAVRFHQPTRVNNGQQVRKLCNLNRLCVADDLETPAEVIAEEIGSDLAALLQAARQNNGRVVCVLPIHRPSSLMEKEADTTDWHDLIMSVPDLCRLLFREGRMDAETHEQAQVFLRGQGQLEQGDQDASILDETIYLDGLALSYLQSAKILEQITSVGLNLRIHPDVLDHMDELIRAGESGEDFAAKIDRIRRVLRNAVESGKASYLPREGDPEAPTIDREDQFTATRSLLAGASHCDVLCIDDRYINSKMHFAVTDEIERVLPIACVIDLLRYIVAGGHLSPERHWTARHKLRSGGFVFVPFEADELLHWLKASRVGNDQLTESAELRAIRQSTVGSVTMGLINPTEIFALFTEATRTGRSVVQSLWTDESLPTEAAVAMSDWLWRHLAVSASGDHGSLEKERSQAWNRQTTLQRLSLVLLPPCIESESRRANYTSWVDDSVLQPLRHANPDLIEEALTSICDMVAVRGDEADMYGHLFLDHLPSSARQYLLTRFPDRARRWGFGTQRVFGLGGDVTIVDRELFATVKQVFSGTGPKLAQSTSGIEVSLDIDPEDGNITLSYPLGDSSDKKKLPELKILSPDPRTRITALRTMLNKCGPTAPDLSLLQSELKTREPNKSELSAIFREATAGVAAVQRTLQRKIDLGEPIDAHDLVPQTISYFEKFVGPRPNTRNPDLYIDDTLIPYRRALMDRDLKKGLNICCIGALHDRLCPGQWITDLQDDPVWEALSTGGAEGTPISLLGALDVALYRQNDRRFHEYASQAVTTLCKDSFGRQEDVDLYQLLWVFIRFVFNRINIIENGSKQPGFWKRMCAWMQAQFIARALSEAPESIAIDSLKEWSMSAMALVGAYAELVDARTEPMLLFSERVPSSDLRSEILGRLLAMRSRHEKEGRSVPRSEEIDQALARAQERGNWLKCFFPGPLEGHRYPSTSVPAELSEMLKQSVPDISLPASWHFIANASHLHKLSDSELAGAREALNQIPQLTDEGDIQDYLLSLEVASILAKASGESLLAESVVDATIKISAKATTENHVWLILVICLQAASVFSEHDVWLDWLEERLARIANRLPGPPSRSVRIFLEHLDAIETILPIDSWFHRRARSIASTGAELRP